jgi:hypothetical protein
MAMQAVSEWSGTDSEQAVEQIAEAFLWSTDGYAICSYLERNHGWVPDSELVEILDDQYLWNAERGMVAEWARNNSVAPEYKVGDEIVFNWYGGTWTGGPIDDIYRDTATYSVKLIRDGQETWVLVPFEDAKSMPALEEAAASAVSIDRHPDKDDETNM